MAHHILKKAGGDAIEDRVERGLARRQARKPLDKRHCI
jgi:hypothetical protein